MKRFIALLFFLVSPGLLRAEDPRAQPFYVSLKANEVNLRNGPSGDYPIKFTYNLRNMPLLVVDKYENWYKTRDKDGDEGWINVNLVNKRRNVIVVGGVQTMYSRPNGTSRPVLRLSENVVAKLIKCKKEWCNIEIEEKKGWIHKESIWGA